MDNFLFDTWLPIVIHIVLSSFLFIPMGYVFGKQSNYTKRLRDKLSNCKTFGDYLHYLEENEKDLKFQYETNKFEIEKTKEDITTCGMKAER